jgi:chaperonin GroES
MKLKAKFSIPTILASDNLTSDFSDEDLKEIGSEVVRTYNMDKDSRQDWEKRTEGAMKLALQVVEAKSFPWPNASNVKFPLITIAALQYHARAYPALVSGTSVVKCRVIGSDDDGAKRQRASRVETHMSYQVLEQDEDWEDQQDRVLITQPIVGCAFKKSYFDPIKGHNISENILAKDLVVDYYTKSLETAQRISHILFMSSNDLYERQVRGIYREIDLYTPALTTQTTLQIAQDKAQGVTRPQADESAPQEIIEQHLFLDLDGDGYKEPYIIVVHKESKEVLRIVARFFSSSIKRNKKDVILSITPENYFTKFPFIPSPDGGFYDLGFGSLLGPLNESINTLINQLLDAGTMSITAGGFLSRGIKLRGGTQSFQPNEWKPVDSTGDDLRKGIMPLPVREPNQVLFTLLSLLINYGERIGGATDVMVGESPGQNTPAETSRNMAEQGMKIFNGIFKRTYRSMKYEFRKLYRLNQLYLDDKVDFGNGSISAEDYNGPIADIVPAADPHMISDSQRLSSALALHEIAKASPGFNMYEVNKRVLEALKIVEIDKVFPDPKGKDAVPPAKHYKVQEAEIKAKSKGEELKGKMQIAQITLMEEGRVNEAKISKLEAEALLILEETDGIEKEHLMRMIDLELRSEKDHKEHLMRRLEYMQDYSNSDREFNKPKE